MTALTLNGRLICAAACSYSIEQNGPLSNGEPVPYYGGAGFLVPPTGIVGDGADDINAALVGTIPDGVVVAIRGTLPPRPPITVKIARDWLNDFNAAPVERDGMPGRVHRGFFHTLETLWPGLRDETRRQLDALGGSAKLFVTGHSKGGGVAPLAAWRFHQAEGIVPRVVTFAGARCGNDTFTESHNDAIAQDRYEFGNDIVPWVPPSDDFLRNIKPLPSIPLKNPFHSLETFDYEPTGSLLYIQRDLEIVGDSDELQQQRLSDISQSILHLNFEQIITDHFLQCGLVSGYMKAVCPTGVCPPGPE
jgi:hypothetical protein